jgi:hypothetical protein
MSSTAQQAPSAKPFQDEILDKIFVETSVEIFVEFFVEFFLAAPPVKGGIRVVRSPYSTCGTNADRII